MNASYKEKKLENKKKGKSICMSKSGIFLIYKTYKMKKLWKRME